MSRYRIVCSHTSGDRYLIQKKHLLKWRFIDFYGYFSEPNSCCSYPSYERAEEALKDIMINFNKYDIVQEFEVNDVQVFKRIKRV